MTASGWLVHALTDQVNTKWRVRCAPVSCVPQKTVNELANRAGVRAAVSQILYEPVTASIVALLIRPDPPDLDDHIQ